VYYVWYLVTPTDLVFDLQLTGPLHLVSQCLEHANVIIHYPHWATAIYRVAPLPMAVLSEIYLYASGINNLRHDVFFRHT
jgi:hypothetical protein